MKRQIEKEKRFDEAQQYNIAPLTFILPQEYSLLVEEYKRTPGQVWIMKPIGKCQGRGIFLFTNLSDIQKWKSDYKNQLGGGGGGGGGGNNGGNNDRGGGKDNGKDGVDDNGNNEQDNRPEAYLAQKYIINPYLVGGKKFDLRLYVLVTNYKPLTVYVHRSGFARFTNSRYNSDITDLASHLTNVAIQKHAEDYDSDTGGKWMVKEVREYISSKHGRQKSDKLFEDIQNIFIRSLLSVQPVMMNDKHCFELYGFDVLIDADLKPWLLEVNASPSLTANTPEDRDLKFVLLNNMLDIIDMEGKMSGEETLIGGFDLVYKNGWVDNNSHEVIKCRVGTSFPSRYELRTVSKKTEEILKIRKQQQPQVVAAPTKPLNIQRRMIERKTKPQKVVRKDRGGEEEEEEE